MMFDSWDGQIWYPRFYDLDTICSYDNSGQIRFDVDIEMEQGYWNTSSSRLWTKIRDWMHDDLVAVYKDMRQNGVTYENLMKYFYDDQISVIPQTYYNKDADIKYIPYANEYIGKAHGDGYQHLKRWLKRRIMFCDTLFDYTPSYTNDMLTIRANTTEPMTLEIETYSPVYQHLSWYNNQMDKKKIDGKISVTFTGTAQASTDQEILIYGGSNIKAIRGISSTNPNQVLIGSATRLTELDLSNCPILTTVNSDKANFTPHSYLNKLDISNSPQLGGILKLSNSPLIRDINAKGTVITGVQLSSSVRNLEVLRLPNTITSLTLQDAPLLNTLEFDEGMALQSISLANCNNLTNTINFDLTQTPTVYLDNSYNDEELYMSATTNLTLRNMSNLKRVIYTPNSEYETFDVNNIINGSNYEIHTFNNPLMKEFITTAPHRNSYNNNVEYKDKYVCEGEEVTEEYALSDERWSGQFIIKNVTTGKENLTNSQCATDYLEVVPNTSCTITTNTIASHVGIVFFDKDKEIIKESSKGTTDNGTWQLTLVAPRNAYYVVFFTTDGKMYTNTITYSKVVNREVVTYKDYGDITPNTAFTANTLDLSDTQFTDIKFLCTTDLYNLKVPTTMKNFYCDSAMDIDTEVITDASYEVIHDELIEPYTTNYEGEVLKYDKIQYDMVSDWENLQQGQPSITDDSLTDSIDSRRTTGYLRVAPGTTLTIEVPSGLWDYRCVEYDENKNILAYEGNAYSNLEGAGTKTFTLSSSTHYVRVGIWRHDNNKIVNIIYNQVKTPNIIPSSANGSLIFNMYSNNTTQPTSTSPYMWDLTGLKLNDFYTFGMNNWVKPSDDSFEYLLYPKICDNWRFGSSGTWGGMTYGTWRVLTPIKFPTDVKNVTITSDQTIIPIVRVSETTNSSESIYSTTYNGVFVDQWGAEKTNGYREVAIGLYNINTHTYVKIETDTGLKYTIYLDKLENITPTNADEVIGYTIDSISAEKIYATVSSITMPQRLAGYSVRMVNADITPNNYATHLYPLLVDTTLPITGKLDYSKYNGTSLAWAYAYVTNDVDITPLGSQNQSNITNDYNKLYGTDFVDIVDVWAYKDDDFSSKSTNEAITEAYIELTSDNYTSRIDEVLQWYPNCTDLYLFDDGSITSLYRLSSFNGVGNNIHKTQIKNITFIEGYFDNLKGMNHTFKGCTSLVSVNNIPSCVNSIYHAFYGCTSLNCQLDFSNNTFLNTTNNDMCYSFYNCSSLTTPPTLPSNYTGSMECCFMGCSKLVEAPTLPDGVIGKGLQQTFQDCKSLTTVPNIPSTCKVYQQTFQGCSSLISVPTDGWEGYMYNTFNGCSSLNQQINISSATNLESTFQNCRGLTITPNLPSTASCSMSSCFMGCTALTTVPAIPNGVTSLNNTFYGCTSLTTAPSVPDSVTNIFGTFCNCTSLIECTIPLTNVTNYTNCLQYCSALTNITWIGERTTDFSLTILGCPSYTQDDIQDLVPEHLGTVESATLTLGDYGTYLSPDEVFLANEKGWTIEGASSDFTIINASDDVSRLTTDENVLSCFIELTNDNYKTRNNEVLQYYPNCTDVYYFDDGSVTTLYNMFTGSGGIVQNQITKMVFMEGYFKNITTLDRLTWYNANLRTLDIRGLNSGKVTSMGAMCMSLNNLTELIGFEDFDLSIVNTMRQLMFECRSFNQHLDLSTATSLTSDGLNYAFQNCSSLTYIPILPSNYTGTMVGCFDGCSKLVEPPTIPDGVTNMNNTFKNCNNLTTCPTIPNGVTNMDGTFYGCKALVNPPIIPDSVTNLYGTFVGCESLITCPTIPNGVTNMGSTFHSCPKITTPPTIPNSVTNLSGTFQNCSSLTTTPTIPNSVTSMASAFRGCSSLTTPPNIPESVTNMNSCFYGCTALLNGAILHENVIDIGYLYYSCSSLKTAQMPVNAWWGSYAPLSHCSSLEDITWVGMLNKDYSVPDLGWLGTNKYITQVDIQELVPEHLEDLYKDTIKLNCNDTKVTINDNEAIYIESARYVEYIQGDGVNYIDTGIYANPQWKYEMVFMDETINNYENYFGSDVSSCNIGVNRRLSADILNINYAGVPGAVTCNITTTKSYKLCIDKNTVYLDDVLINSTTELSDTTSFARTILIFSQWVSSNVGTASNFKLYSFKMWDENGTLQFDGRPCLVNEKYPCLYDEVSKRFFFPKS